MGNLSDENKDCGCDGNCCAPKHRPMWKIILSIAILVAAIAIVTVKLVHVRSAPSASNIPAVNGKSSCSDTTGKTGCDTSKSSSCCPKPGK